jgi:hypothetical protein
MSLLHPHPESWLEKIGDALMLPLMYLLQMNIREVPQRTHFWNNTKYPNDAVRHLDADAIISIPGDAIASRRWFGPLPIFHMPIIGGWKKFVVLEPTVPQDQWYIGWIAGDTLGVSHITLRAEVRVLQGPGAAQFFGQNEHGEQIQLRQVGVGEVGRAGEFSHVPLL